MSAQRPASLPEAAPKPPPSQEPAVTPDIVAINKKLVDAVGENQRLGDKIDTLQRENQRLVQQLANSRNELDKSNGKIAEMEGEITQLADEAIAAAQNMVTKERLEFEARTIKQKDDFRLQVFKLKNELSETKEMLDYYRFQLDELKEIMLRADNERPPAPKACQKHKSDPSTNPIKPEEEGDRHARITPIVIPDDTPLSFDHIINPIFRTDLDAYHELGELLYAGCVARAKVSAQAEGASQNLQPNNGPHSKGHAQRDSGSSTTGIRFSPFSTLRKSNTDAEATPTGSPQAEKNHSNTVSSPTPSPALQASRVGESKLYQRLLVEDIRPTLDTNKAPGLNFFTRRTFMSALLAGAVDIEPYSPDKPPSSPPDRTGSRSPPERTGALKLGWSFSGEQRSQSRQPSSQGGDKRPSSDNNTSIISKMLPPFAASSSPSTENNNDAGRPQRSSGYDHSDLMPPIIQRPPEWQCTLCSRVGTPLHPDQGQATHVMRIGEAENGGGNISTLRPLPICDWCVGRVRACIELVAYLRMVAAGIYRPSQTHSFVDPQSHQAAWKDLTQLRERLFWRRIGAGVLLKDGPGCDCEREHPNGSDPDQKTGRPEGSLRGGEAEVANV